MRSRPKNLPTFRKKEEIISEIIRVDHAGEYGAKCIYEGQLATIRKGSSYQEIKHMYTQELKHLEYFEQQVKTRRVRPTVLQPLWKRLGFALGAATAFLGSKSAMACTVAVEDTIEEHYESQLNQLRDYPEEKELVEKITKFREEEIEHRDKGLEHNAKKTLGYNVLYSLVQCASKMAIWLSKKV